MKEVMRIKHVLALALVGFIILLGFAGQVKAQNSVWTSNGPYGGYICDIAISPNYTNDQTVFAAAAQNGVYKSTNGGNFWIQVIDPTDYIRAIAVSPNYASDQTVFAGAYKSTDGGDSWTKSGVPISTVFSFAISSNYAVDETIFAGGCGGVAKSSDGGVTWALINTGFTYSLAISPPDYSSDGTIFAGQGDGLYRSTNGGDTWERVLTESDYPEALVLSPNYAVDQTIFVGFWNEPTHKSTNGGTTWISIGQSGTTALAISPDFSSDQTIFAGNIRGGVSESTNAGDTWTEVSNGLVTSWVQSLAVSPNFFSDQTIFAGLGRGNDGPGIYKSTVGANLWTEANTGLNIGRDICSLAFSPDYIKDNTVFASSGGYQGDVYKSVSSGDSWSMVGSGVGGALAISPDYVNDRTIFAAGSGYSVYKSTDGGNSWVKAGTGLHFNAWWDLAISPNYPSDPTIFVGGNAGVYKSTNDGTSWTAVNNDLTDTAINEIEISPNYTADRTIFAGGNNKGVFKSTNGGASWTAVSDGLPTTTGYQGPSVDALIISSNYQNDQTLFVAVRQHGVFKSTNGGNLWAQVNADAYSTSAFAISPNYASDQTIFVATSYHYGTWRGVLKSIDGGVTWSQLSNLGLPEDIYIGDIAIPPNYPSDQTIFAGTRDGVWTTTIVTITNNPPVADAGPDQSAYVGDTVTLDGSGSGDADGDPLTFSWAFTSTPPGSAATLNDAASVNPTFTADAAGTYVVSLVVNDVTVDSTPDTVTISTINVAPIADAGDDQSVNVGDIVSLDGSGSTDADGDQLTYSWAFTSTPSGSTATLNNPTSVSPTFTADVPGTYVVSLIVNDGTVNSEPDTVTISTINVAPIADAGPDQSAYVGDTVTLDGSGSGDADGDPLTFSWAFTSTPPGSAATLNDAASVNPTFTADAAGTYVVSLVVNDVTVDSTPDTVTISTINVAPIADAGDDQSVNVGDIVSLDGSGSTDADGDQLTYSWAFTSTPSGSTATLNNPTSVSPTFTADVPGTYVVSLIVNDGTVNSEPDTVTISTINVAPIADAGDDQSVNVGNLVTLDGSNSWDPDGDPLTFSWAFTSTPSGSTATLNDAASVNPTFTADAAGTYVVSLVVNDVTVDSTPDTVTISTINVAPIADAGDDQSVNVGDIVSLDGSGSTDADGDQLTYSWAFTSTPSGSTATLNNPTSVSPTFTADVPGTYVVSLIVNDGTVDSEPSTVTISAVTKQTEAISMVQDEINVMNGLGKEVFNNPNNKKALTSKLNAVIEKLENDECQDALKKLENDLLKKTDGCALTGNPDKNDWIRNCEAQNQVYPLIMDTIELLRGMI